MNHSRRLKNRTANRTSYQDRPRPDATQNPGPRRPPRPSTIWWLSGMAIGAPRPAEPRASEGLTHVAAPSWGRPLRVAPGTCRWWLGEYNSP